MMNTVQYAQGKYKAGDLVEFVSSGRVTTALLLEDPQPPRYGNYPFSFKILHDPYGRGTPLVERITERTGWPKEKLS